VGFIRITALDVRERSLVVKEEYRLRVFENRALSRILGSKREEVTGGCRTLNNEEHHNLYSSPNIRMFKQRKGKRVGHVAHMREMRNEYTFWFETLKRPCVRRRDRMRG
jgi:hypothetical protein